MNIAIIGLNQSGKSTIFRAVSGSQPSKDGIITVKVPDERVDKLSAIFKPKKTTYATIEFKDTNIELDEGGGFSSKTKDKIRNSDALCIVVRCFKNDAVPHPLGNLDPLRDFNEIVEELMITDMIQIEKRLERLKKESKQNSKEFLTLARLLEVLNSGKTLNQIKNITDEERKIVSGFKFLTIKPFIVVINLDEKESVDPAPLIAYLRENNYSYIKVYGKIEEEINQLDKEDRAEFMRDIGVSESIIGRLISKAYEILNLISFLTVGEDEVRAWTTPRGSSAVEAAGKIHSDIARGFIRAEVIHYDDFIREGSYKKCREKGLIRTEGKTYTVKDGDIINFRFNV